jgi:hypothetical protein
MYSTIFRSRSGRDNAGAQSAEALRYKSESREFNSQLFTALILSVSLCHRGRLSLWQKLVAGIFPEGKDGLCVGLTILPPSRADCLEILEASNSWIPKGLSRAVME